MGKFLIVALSLIATGCSPSGPEVRGLRIANDGTHAIDGLVVIFPESRIEYGHIPAGASSAYKAVPRGVYRYASFEFKYRGVNQRRPALDFVGEVPMSGQRFTYVIDYDPERPRYLDLLLLEVWEDGELVWGLERPPE